MTQQQERTRAAGLVVLATLVLALATGTALAGPGVLVVTSDYETGSLSLLPADAEALQVDLLTVHGDAVAQYRQGLVYVLNRLGQDNVLVLEPARLDAPLRQFSVGNGANPQDIEVAGLGKAYVSRLGSTSVLVVDPGTGEARGEVDLSPFADADGLPEMAEMALVGDRLYVACQRIDRDNNWAPVGDSYVAVIDTATDALVDQDAAQPGVQGIRLASANPGSLVPAGSRLLVSCSGAFGVADGGIEAVDLESGQASLLIGEEALGGDVTSLAMVTVRRGYVVISDANFANSVRPVDLETGQVGAPLERHSGGYTPSLVTDGERLYVADRGSFTDAGAAGLLVYDAGDGSLLAGPLYTGLPPASLAVLEEVRVPTAVLASGAARPSAAQLGPAYPNPFNGSVHLPLVAPGEGVPVSLDVWDVLGRRVRTLVAGSMSAGPQVVAWDGRDGQGRHAGSGVYLVRLEAGEVHATARILLLR
ncbi:MAG: FlgD immunoglobulin-like domain containing protein [Candidatus Latescibacterota bacterium]